MSNKKELIEPSKMKRIDPPRELPSIEEMDKEYELWLLAEEKKEFDDAIFQEQRQKQLEEESAKASRKQRLIEENLEKQRKEKAELRRNSEMGMNRKSEAHDGYLQLGLRSQRRSKRGSRGLGKTKSAVPQSVLDKRKEDKEKERQKHREACVEAQEKKALEPAVIEIKYDIDEEEENEISKIKAENPDFKPEVEDISALVEQSISIVEAREAREAEEKQLQDEIEEEEKHFIKTMSRQKPKPNLFLETKAPEKTPELKIEVGFKGIIEQKTGRVRRPRALAQPSEPVIDNRSLAFSKLASKEETAVALTNTMMCRTIMANKKCYRANCRYAHRAEDLRQRECMFGADCRLVKQQPDGQYSNAKKDKHGYYCQTIHPGETQKGYCIRLGIQYTSTEKVQVSIPSQESKHSGKWSDLGGCQEPTSSTPSKRVMCDSSTETVQAHTVEISTQTQRVEKVMVSISTQTEPEMPQPVDISSVLKKAQAVALEINKKIAEKEKFERAKRIAYEHAERITRRIMEEKNKVPK